MSRSVAAKRPVTSPPEASRWHRGDLFVCVPGTVEFLPMPSAGF